MDFVLPRIISVDDHVVEPPDLFLEALPERFRSRAPRVERRKVQLSGGALSKTVVAAEGPDAQWVDCWIYDDLVWPLQAGYAAIGKVRKLQGSAVVTYDDIERSCFVREERLKAMDFNYMDASLCFPTMPRFCGQHFMERADKSFALVCVQAYNDWILEYWCAGPAVGRLIPNIIVPLWDAELAAAEVRRCAAKGARGISFSECPPHIGLPSIHSGYWNPLFAACNETNVVVNMHVGTSSRVPVTGPDAPLMVSMALIFQNSQAALVDWLSSGLLEKYSSLKIALSEGQAGWLPFALDRVDSLWKRAELYESDMHARVPRLPSEYIQGRVFACMFDDIVGLRNRHAIGMSQLMFEVDFPHVDSTYPNTEKLARDLIAQAGLDEQEAHALMRGNAVECYRLQEFGLS